MTTRTTTSLTYQWKQVPCGDRGGPIEFQCVLYDDDGQQVDIVTTTDFAAMFEYLLPCGMYNFTVRAFNDAGYGDFSVRYKEGTDAEGNKMS